MTEEQIQKEAEELYPRVNINDCSSDMQFHNFVGLIESSRSAHIKARRQSLSEIEELKAQVSKLKIELSNYAYQIDSAKRDRDRAEAEVERLRKENEWISVEDKLPDDGLLHLVIAYGEYKLSAYGIGYKCWIQTKNDNNGDGDYDIRLDGVTHWRPLPSPPKHKQS